MNAQSGLVGELTPADIELIFDALTEGVLILAPQGRIGLINSTACRMLGIDRREATQLDWEQLARKQLALDISVLPARLEELCQIENLELQSRGDIGSKVLCRATPICRRDQRQPLVVLVFAQGEQEREPRAEDQHKAGTGRSEAAGPVAQEPAGADRLALRAAATQEQRELLCRTLEATGWNVAKAARRLKLSRTTLYARIARYGLVRPKE